MSIIFQETNKMKKQAFTNVAACNIELRGRWCQMMDVIAGGWIERIAKSEHPVYYGMYWNRTWAEDDESDCFAAHYAAYVAVGLAKVARLAPNSYVGKKYRDDWLPKFLASQDANGYLGGGQVENCYIIDFSQGLPGRRVASSIPNCEGLNVALTLELVLWEYAFSHDDKSLQAASKFADFIVDHYLTELDLSSFSSWISGWLSSIRKVCAYNPKAEEGLKKLERHLAKKYSDYQWPPHITGHNVHAGMNLRGLAESGNPALLTIAEKGVENIIAYSMQATGVPAAHERFNPKGPRHYTEHCQTVVWPEVCLALFQATGKVKYADMAERCVYNAYFGSKKPDGRSLAYAHAPNQLYATKWAGICGSGGEKCDDDMGVGFGRSYYSMKHEPFCCNAITNRLFPEYVENTACLMPDNTVALVLYGPSQVSVDFPDGSKLTILQETDYPFEDEIRLTLSLEASRSFSLQLRIPTWCKAASVAINGEKQDVSASRGDFAKLDREWKNGDNIVLNLTPEISLDFYKRKGHVLDFIGLQEGTAIIRGPLCFALPVKENWEYIGEPKSDNDAHDAVWNANKDKPVGYLTSNTFDEAWSVTPAEDAVWNVALDLDVEDPEKSLELVKLNPPKEALPWDREAAPIGLKVWGRHLPEWQPDRISGYPYTPALPGKIGKTGKREQFMLIPFMFTRLRMTYLPLLTQDDSTTGNDKIWSEAPPE